MCINRPLYQCEGAVFFSSEMRKVRASVNSDFSEALHPDSRTLYPELGNRDWGIEESRNRIWGSVSHHPIHPSPFLIGWILLR
jgi:hypothetical protein